MSLRAALKSSVISLNRRVPRRRAGERLVVLLYHSVHPDAPYSSASPQDFRRQLEWLQQACDIVPLSEIPVRTSEARTRPAVAITFDDGHADNYLYAFPILAELGIPATFFLTSGYLEKDASVISRLALLSRGPVAPMDWSQADEMRKGGMSFGAHTVTHPDLAVAGRSKVQEELRGSREALQQRLGEKVDMFAYPFGRQGWHFTKETIDVVREVGFTLATSVGWRPVRPADCPFTIPRYWVIQDDLEALKEKVLGVMDFLDMQERIPLAIARRLYAAEFDR